MTRESQLLDIGYWSFTGTIRKSCTKRSVSPLQTEQTYPAALREDVVGCYFEVISELLEWLLELCLILGHTSRKSVFS
jgi:hypothetical protein